MTTLPFNPRTITAKEALAELESRPDLTVAELADLLAEEGRHTKPRAGVRNELNARIEAAAALDDAPENEAAASFDESEAEAEALEEDVADEPDEEDEPAEAGDEVLAEDAGPLELGDDVTISFGDGTVHEGRFKRYVAGIEVVMRDQRDTVLVSLDGDWVRTPQPPEPEEVEEEE